MLVCVWEAMDAAIPRIAAQEWMDAYTVSVVSSPYVDKDSRENILSGWRTLISGAWNRTIRSGDKEFLTDGSELHRHPRMALRDVVRAVQNAFGRSIRD